MKKDLDNTTRSFIGTQDGFNRNIHKDVLRLGERILYSELKGVRIMRWIGFIILIDIIHLVLHFIGWL